MTPLLQLYRAEPQKPPLLRRRLESLQPQPGRLDIIIRMLTVSSEEGTMIDNDLLMDYFDKWNSRERRERFLHRMEHKLRAKQQHTR